MKIAVFGLGYVGTVTAAVLAENGNSVIGVDVDSVKVKGIRSGRSPVLEPLLDDIIAKTVRDGSLIAVSNPAEVGDWKVAFVCVGTPSGPAGQLDPSALRSVVAEIGQQIVQRADYPVVVIRSTVAPHILNDIIVPQLTETSGMTPGTSYGLVVMPEFLREGSSVQDFVNPPFTLIGESDSRSGDVMQELFSFINAPAIRVGMGEAVMVKYASNAFHALKVAFANEIGLLCSHEALDGHEVMAAFCRDSKLNISSGYLKPGFAFGGSCLPKDLRALNHRARQADIETPLLNSVIPSNRSYLEHCSEVVLATDRKRIGVLGISFKSGTDDLRESPMISLIEILIGKGKEISIYDSNVRLAQLTGANRQYIENTIPHIAKLIKADVKQVIMNSEVLVLANDEQHPGNLSDLTRDGQIIINFSKPLFLQQHKAH